MLNEAYQCASEKTPSDARASLPIMKRGTCHGCKGLVSLSLCCRT